MPLSGAAEPSDAESLPTLFPVPEPAPRRPARRRRPGPPADPVTGAATDAQPRSAGAVLDSAEPDRDPERTAGLGRADDDPGRATAGPAPARRAATADPRRQLAIFGAEATDPSVADLAGLLAGPAEVSVMGGTARLSVVVDAAWRVHVLVTELAARGLRASWAETADGRHAVRTSYTRILKPLAEAWLGHPTKRPPDGFHLNGRRLRLWLAAAGSVRPPDVLLHLGPADEERLVAVGAALAAVGLPAAPEEATPTGPAFRITGRGPRARLAELVGDAPPKAPSAAWPVRP
ncbi:hypothetical protein QTQ03_22100 [Micromonospora sp. WMMA1363]|uniref:hypothetical protein n=1 Tax=Micromonospora sp. WMMA1363 TaxID=3053985 RepID=UPI00259CE92F|nr:hypothetical protein [Micromonospora sp. WMMA1363]MDM4722150.1 hypothetical protein [Micromonospora sp. WMMA1363]